MYFTFFMVNKWIALTTRRSHIWIRNLSLWSLYELLMSVSEKTQTQTANQIMYEWTSIQPLSWNTRWNKLLIESCRVESKQNTAWPSDCELILGVKKAKCCDLYDKPWGNSCLSATPLRYNHTLAEPDSSCVLSKHWNSNSCHESKFVPPRQTCPLPLNWLYAEPNIMIFCGVWSHLLSFRHGIIIP